jgi:hypothetical protein
MYYQWTKLSLTYFYGIKITVKEAITYFYGVISASYSVTNFYRSCNNISESSSHLLLRRKGFASHPKPASIYGSHFVQKNVCITLMYLH